MSNYMQAIERLRKQQEEEELNAASNPLISPLMSNPNAKKNFIMSSMALRMGALMGKGSQLGDAAGVGLMATLPIMAKLGSGSDTKRRVENQAIREYGNYAPGSYGVADILKLGMNASDTASNRMGNLRNVLLGLGAISGNPLLQAGATAAWGASNMTRGIIPALSTLGGFGLYGASKLGLTSVQSSSPIMTGMSLMPALAGTALGGAGHVVGGLANMLGLSTVGSGIHAASSGIMNLGGMATAAGLANPLLGMLLSMPVMMGLAKGKQKLTEFIDSKSTGIQLLRKGNAIRPILKYASQLEMTYNHTAMINKQVAVAGQQGQLKPFEWFALAYLGDIASSNSLLRFIAEEIQGNSTQNKGVGANNTQNRLQTYYGFKGDKISDLTKAFINTSNEYYENYKLTNFDDPAVQSMAAGKGWKRFLDPRYLSAGLKPMENEDWWTAAKFKAGSAASKFSRFTDIAGAAIDPMAYFQGGEHSVFGKIKAYKEKDRFNEVIKKVSNQSGIPTSFLVALETTGSSLANMGDTPEEKLVALTGGMYELIRFSAFRLQDIATKLGVSEEDSAIGKIDKMLKEAEDKEDTRNLSWWERFQEGIAESGFGNIAAAGLGLSIAGVGGAIGGLALAGPLATYYALNKRKKAKEAGLLKDSKEAVEATEVSEAFFPESNSPGSTSSILTSIIDKMDDLLFYAEDIAVNVGSLTMGGFKSNFANAYTSEGSPINLLLTRFDALLDYAETTSIAATLLAECIDCDSQEALKSFTINGNNSVDDDQLALIRERERDKERNALFSIAENVAAIREDLELAFGIDNGSLTLGAGLFGGMFRGMFNFRGRGPSNSDNDGGSDDDTYGYVDLDLGDGDDKKKKKNKNKTKGKAKGKKGIFKRITQGVKDKFMAAPGTQKAKAAGQKVVSFAGDMKKASGLIKGGSKIISKVAAPLMALDAGYDLYDATFEGGKVDYSTMGMAAGAAIGAWFGGVGAVPGAAIGSLIGWGMDAFMPRDESPEARKIELAKEKFEEKHEDWFGWFSDDGEYKVKNNKLYFIHDNGDVWDVMQDKKVPKNRAKKGAKKIAALAGGLMLEKAAEIRKAINAAKKDKKTVQITEKEIQEVEKYLKDANKKFSDISTAGYNKNEIDTTDELKALLDAIRQDQQVVGKMTAQQQAHLIEAVYGLIDTIAAGNKHLNKNLMEYANAVKMQDAPTPEIGNH